MFLLSATTRYLHQEDLLAQLAALSGLPEAEAGPYAELAVAALVRQLAQPASAAEQRLRWTMCQQLYLSQLLTDSAELLRTDLGWPNRRRYLAERLLGVGSAATLAATTQHPAAATVLLGFLTVLTLAVAGEHASQAGLDSVGLTKWLRHLPSAASPRAVPARAAMRTTRPLKLAAAIGGLVLVGLGGDLAAEERAEISAVSPAATPVVAAAPPPPMLVAASPPLPAPVADEPAEAAAPAVVSSVPASPPLAVKRVATGPLLRDTLGNAAMARAIGGRFSVAQGRYLKGEGQPLTIKLVERATLTVGINSTESLLYKRLANPALPRPTDLVLDRLAFDNSRAKLGAEGAQQLGSVASLLKTFPKIRVLVLGHANIAEDEATKLGLQRATIAVEELQKQGIDPGRLQAQGVLATGIPTENDSAERQALLQGISLKISRL